MFRLFNQALIYASIIVLVFSSAPHSAQADNQSNPSIVRNSGGTSIVAVRTVNTPEVVASNVNKNPLNVNCGVKFKFTSNFTQDQPILSLNQLTECITFKGLSTVVTQDSLKIRVLNTVAAQVAVRHNNPPAFSSTYKPSASQTSIAALGPALAIDIDTSQLHSSKTIKTVILQPHEFKKHNNLTLSELQIFRC